MPNIGIEYPEARQMRFYDLADPGPLEPDQILIRTRYSAITNGTERHALMAEFGWKRFPSRHGYQHVGVIVEVGKQSTSTQTSPAPSAGTRRTGDRAGGKECSNPCISRW